MREMHEAPASFVPAPESWHHWPTEVSQYPCARCCDWMKVVSGSMTIANRRRRLQETVSSSSASGSGGGSCGSGPPPPADWADPSASSPRESMLCVTGAASDGRACGARAGQLRRAPYMRSWNGAEP